MAGEEHPSAVGRMKLGSHGLVVSRQGLGCNRLNPDVKPEADLIELVNHAVRSGVTFFDTADCYSNNASEILLGKSLRGALRQEVELATKFGCSYVGDEVRGDPEYVRAACEASLKRLGVDCIDLYYQHRVDTRIPIEVTMGEIKKLVEEGKIRYVGLSEASASTIRRANAVHPISAVQLEWSLWSRDSEEVIIPTCRELGIGIVAYSPLGKGFLSVGTKVIERGRIRNLPRFQPGNLEHNTIIFERLSEMAVRKGCTPSQLALAWLHHQGDDVCPIPGTTKLENFNQNIGALDVKLTPDNMAELEEIAHPDAVKGERNRIGVRSWRNSDTPPLSSWQGE